MIIFIICFLFFFFAGFINPAMRASKLKGGLQNLARVIIDLDVRVYTQHGGLQSRCLGLHTLPCGVADPLTLGLQPSVQVCPSTQGWADPALGVCMLGPRVALAPSVCSLGCGQVCMADQTPMLGSPSIKCLQPQGACL